MIPARLCSALTMFALAVAPASAQGRGKPLRIAVVQSLVADVSKETAATITKRLSQVMTDLTGLEAETEPAADAFTMAQALEKNDKQIGVLHGYEYAWVQKEHP